MTANLNAMAKQVTPTQLGPVQLSEIVLKTAQFETLRDWYASVLGFKPFLERSPPKDHRADSKLGAFVRASDMRLCFFQLHMQYPYKQVLGIFEVPIVSGEAGDRPGLHHMQFRQASLGALIDRYEILRSAGVVPFRTANHGLGTSFYYRDPDRNTVEFSGPNFETEAEHNAFQNSDAFRRNPSGAEIDVEAFVRRFRSGVSIEELVALD
jgi:catechol 2,3-dioxygenase-like lactoylglutathione lyase family enzyme